MESRTQTTGENKSLQRSEIKPDSQAERSNRASVLLLKAIEQVADAIIITDNYGRIQYANPAAEAVTGYRSDELSGSSPRIWSSGLHDASFYDKMWSCLNAGQVWRGQITNSRKSGSYYVADLTISPIVDSDGIVTHYVGIQRDLTQRIIERQERSRAVRGQARADLVASIAASLGKPFEETLNTVSRMLAAHSELINLCERRCECLGEDGFPNFDSIKEEENLARAKLTRATGQIQEFLKDLERLSKPGGERQLANVADLAHIAVRVCKRNFRDVAQVNEQSDDPLPLTLCYADELVEVFVILINNAADSIRNAMESGGGVRGAIEVLVESIDGFIQIRIIDSGQGIPEEFKEKVFERLFTTKDVIEGYGHGLYLAKEIIERHHEGTINFSSKIEAGTVFTIRIPLVSSDESGTLRS